jgi:hypothetical protein
MAVIFPITASLLFRQTTGPWYNGSNAPGSGSLGELSYDNMDYNWYNLNSASYQIIETIKGAAYTGSSNTFTQPNTFTSNVGISGSLTGSTARFSGQVFSSYPGVGFVGTASWALNVVGGGGGGTQNLQSVTTIGNQTSASVILLGGVTGSSFTGSFTGSFLGNLSGNLFGTSSQAISSSYSITSSYTNQALSSSYAITASYVKITGSNGIFINYGPNGIELTQSYVYPNLQDVTTLGNQTSESIYITGSLSNGDDAIAYGLFTHAEGIQTLAYNDYSHAEGSNTSTLADASHTEGYYTTTAGNLSHAEGWYTTTLSIASHTEGYYTTTLGPLSHAEGSQTVTIGLSSHAEGTGSITVGLYSHAEGSQTITIGSGSHAEGFETTTIGNYSHAEGSYTITSGSFSHAEGVSTITSGSFSHAEGAQTISVGDYSHAEGYLTTAIGQGSHAEGEMTTALLLSSHAEGQYTTAGGFASHTEGNQTKTDSSYQHAEGIGTIATTKLGQHVEGTYNALDSNAIWIVGNGGDNTNRSNLIAAYSGSNKLTVTGSLQVTGSTKFTGPVIVTGSENYLTLPVMGTNPNFTPPYNTSAIPIGSMVVYINGSTTSIFVKNTTTGWASIT